MAGPVVVRSRGSTVAKLSIAPVITPGNQQTIARSKPTIVKSIGGVQGPKGDAGPDDICTSPVLEAVAIGQPLYTDPLGAGVGLASSAALPRACFAGIAVTPAAVGFATNYRVSGCFELSTAQWDAVTGQTGGLSPGATYFLDSTNGMLTTTPTDAGYLVQVGHALSTTSMALEGDGPIKL